MSDDRSDGFTMIGLHRLASESGDGHVPELYALMGQRQAPARDQKIIPFPREAARPPGDVPAAVFGRDAATGRNVIAFAAVTGKTSGRASKA